ncbi:MAG: type II toxin-antitoxin system MqsA family antitoxin [Methanocalculus sp.]|uniref:type II toxin-antitoxin system MqsA family antitoxin n=1 Tax=Methanocalculus sp. TaxID=2004547 RepID=UPI002726F943|nr:type II toxin-antitoxin system MqsA family antitoxin [Methanocalculus sp.]MDO9539858.1 type II toxin-antitoxin system MqsA family antitoxin [Methanocalculus sp.]
MPGFKIRSIVIRDVPAFICRQCGEAYYSATTSRRIDIVMDRVHKGTIGKYSRPLTACEVTLPTLP